MLHNRIEWAYIMCLGGLLSTCSITPLAGWRNASRGRPSRHATTLRPRVTTYMSTSQPPSTMPSLSALRVYKIQLQHLSKLAPNAAPGSHIDFYVRIGSAPAAPEESFENQSFIPTKYTSILREPISRPSPVVPIFKSKWIERSIEIGRPIF